MSEADLDYYERVGRRMAVRRDYVGRAQTGVSIKGYAAAVVLSVPAWALILAGLRLAFGVL